jgi:hypothetical protein
MKIFKLLILPILLIITISVEMVSAAVTLVDFTAQTINLKVILEWETASETNMQYFVILRSDQYDGNYTQISDFIFTQGSAESGLTYQFTDSNVIQNKTYYYKLEAVDFDYRTQSFGPISITVLSATYTNTVTPSKTMTVTGTITPNTPTMTGTITPSPTLNLTATDTPTRTPTSPFSFITNTATPTATYTRRFSPTPQQLTSTNTPEFTRTFEIVEYLSQTPNEPTKFTLTPTPTPKIFTRSFKFGAIGFGLTIVLGALVLFGLTILQKQRH